jgi:Mitochondrial ATP synthase B chain precursor (ATP-synt_B)
MTSRFQPYILLYIILAFCVASSKHLLIYNEETLVCICFFSFIYVIKHYFGDTIAASIQERATSIHDQLKQSYVAQIQQESATREELKKILPISQALNKLSSRFFQSNSSRKKTVVSDLKQQIDLQLYKMYTFLYKEKQSFPQKLQKVIHDNVLISIQQSLKHRKKGRKTTNFLQDAKKKLRAASSK